MSYFVNPVKNGTPGLNRKVDLESISVLIVMLITKLLLKSGWTKHWQEWAQ